MIQATPFNFVVSLASLLLICILVPDTLAKRAPPTNVPGRPLIVMVSPSVWDLEYKDSFHVLVQFYLDAINSILGRDNVLIVVDRHTMPFYKDKVPDDIMLDAHIYDIWIRDFAPFQSKKNKLVKFKYQPEGVDPFYTKVMDESWIRFAEDNYLEYETSDLKLQGRQVVSNGEDRAIISEEVFALNEDTFKDWAIRIQLRNFFGKTVTIPPPQNSTYAHSGMAMPFENLMQFADNDLLIMAEFDESDKANIVKPILKGFSYKIRLMELHMFYMEEEENTGHPNTCGLHTAFLATDKFIYLPVYANDPANWKMGHGSMMDMHAVQMIQVNTHKEVVPVNIPHMICGKGASLPSLTWKVTGNAADHMISLARMRSNIRISLENQKLKQLELNGGNQTEPSIDESSDNGSGSGFGEEISPELLFRGQKVPIIDDKSSPEFGRQ